MSCTPDWLKDLVPAFADPKVGLVQAPQDHRDGERSVDAPRDERRICRLLRHRHGRSATRYNAIIVHGTMCLIRRAALDAAGGWSSDTICEDTDLGLTILEHGWHAHYTNRRYGHGLLPDTFEAYKKQRHRWAYGGLQIIKKHWRRFLPGASRLTRDQKREFALGWLNWLGAESLGVVVALLNMIWVPVVAFLGIAIPDKMLTAADHRGLRRVAAAFRRALSPARRDPAGQTARRGVRRDVGAMDGRARGRHRPDQGSPALRAHRQGRRGAQGAANSRPSGKR